MKVARIIVIANVLVCFLLNNLLFTYSVEKISFKKSEKTIFICQPGDDCCTNKDPKSPCCEEGNCCANVPATHLSFSAIVGIDKKNETLLPVAGESAFDRFKLNSDAQLADGFLNSLIKPPAIA